MTQERVLQKTFHTSEAADGFYDRNMRDHLSERMVHFIKYMEMMFIATADKDGHCDSSVRCGPQGFVQVLSERQLAFPDYKGNGVFASLGNIEENQHIGLLFIDFEESTVGLHVNGAARLVLNDAPDLPSALRPDPLARSWVLIDIDECYIHCAKHIPQMKVTQRPKKWGTDDASEKKTAFFRKDS